MAYVTDEERVAKALGIHDSDGPNGKISKQFTSNLESHEMRLDEILKFDKESLRNILKEIIDSIDTYRIYKACVRGKLLRLLDGTHVSFLFFFFFSSIMFVFGILECGICGARDKYGNGLIRNDTLLIRTLVSVINKKINK